MDHQSPPPPRTALLTAVLSALAITTGCSDPGAATGSVNPSPVFASAITREMLDAALAPEARAQLGEDGRFLPAQIDEALGSHLSPADAAALATVYAHAYAPHNRTALEAESGEPIPFGALEPCDRPLYGASPYQISAGNASIADRNAAGPVWFVSMCAGGRSLLSVAVAALATELRIERGLIVLPKAHGNDIYPRGIPVGWDGAVAVSAERAAVLAYSTTGQRVASAPRLVLAGIGWIPQAAQWAIELEPPTASAGHSPVDRVYVGLRLDGIPAVGNRAAIVQVPSALSPSAQQESRRRVQELTGNTAMVSDGHPFGWRTAFVEIR